VVVPIVESTEDTMENHLCTGVHHICEQVAKQIRTHLEKKNNTPNVTSREHSLFVSGGGALNDFMIETLQDKLGDEIQVAITEKKLIEFKEAAVFALMGALRMENKINVLCSVTGAKCDSSSGVIYLPN